MLDSNKIKEIIAKNIALELKPNSYINLGVGVPTLVANYITPEQNIILHAENGLVGTGRDLTVEGLRCYQLFRISSYIYERCSIYG